ncbi:hypothetical protein [Rhizobium leguminosarum]|uniref:hypothetical protein n=1 Tax=Rhizobium leguminosarum TaxID=384 RepID=UPI000DE31C42|nr:hypothetical protein [Rhizobium leguminosarum]TCA08606.1 hypothetical protein E0H63_07325 [Rhizobium leguminosarum bv. viciae]
MSPDPKLDRIVKAYRECVVEAAVNNAASSGGNVLAAVNSCDGKLAEYRQMLASLGMAAPATQKAAADLKESTRKAVGGILMAAAVDR